MQIFSVLVKSHFFVRQVTCVITQKIVPQCCPYSQFVFYYNGHLRGDYTRNTKILRCLKVTFARILIN
jgi:hypothetical protein